MILYTPDELARLSSSEMIKDIYTSLQLASQGKIGKRKFELLSAHDTTLQALLYGLELTNEWSWPVYASTIVFELFKDDHEVLVKVLFNDSPVRIGDCKSYYCSLDTLVNYMKSRSYEDF